MKLAAARALALALPEVIEADHHGRASFRVRGKIFATVPDDDHLNVMLSAEAIDIALQRAPAACTALRWGQRLAGVQVVLAKIKPTQLTELLDEAWRGKAPRALVPR